MSEAEYDLQILEVLEGNPNTTQANLAAQLGVAVGSVNWYLKRLITKGYVKAKQMERRRLKYFVTPEGLALKAKLTKEYMEVSLRVYRELRQAAQETAKQILARGYTRVKAPGKNEAMDIFRLTCLEQGLKLEKENTAPNPEIKRAGKTFTVIWPEEAE